MTHTLLVYHQAMKMFINIQRNILTGEIIYHKNWNKQLAISDTSVFFFDMVVRYYVLIFHRNHDKISISTSTWSSMALGSDLHHPGENVPLKYTGSPLLVSGPTFGGIIDASYSLSLFIIFKTMAGFSFAMLWYSYGSSKIKIISKSWKPSDRFY